MAAAFSQQPKSPHLSVFRGSKIDRKVSGRAVVAPLGILVTIVALT